MGLFGKKKKEADNRASIMLEREFILGSDTDFLIHESYNRLRSNIIFSLPNSKCKIIGVTSSDPGEGKSISAMNIAISFAEINKKVILLDLDMRKPKVHRLLGVKASPGMSNILVGACEPSYPIRKVENRNIDIITSGDIPPNSTQLLDSARLKETFDYLSDHYDYVIIDTPPMNSVIDASIIAKVSTGFIFVIKQNYASKERISQAVEQINFAGGKVIGFLFNDVVDGSMSLGGAYRSKYGKYKYKYKYKYKNYKDDYKREYKS